MEEVSGGTASAGICLLIHSFDGDKLPQGYYSHAGTVLLRKDSSATGQSILLFLRDAGPRWVSAPGARGRKARFGGATEPLVWGEFSLYQSPQRLYLKSAEIKEDFLNIRQNPRRVTAAIRLYKRVARTLMEGAESNKTLTSLWSSMVLINGGCPPEAVEFRFSWRLLRSCGFAPSLRECARCSSVLDGPFKWGEDGLLCNECASGPLEDSRILYAMQRAALLPHEKFSLWSKRTQIEEKFLKEQINKLATFFSDFN
jgi:DNA repair protein RecO (recombination protein O)